MFAMRVSLFFLLLMTQLFSAVENEPADPTVQIEGPSFLKEIVQTPTTLSKEPIPLEVIADASEIAMHVKPAENPNDGYTINYNTISIIEYIRFASKICKINFIYEEADLNFAVTILSDEPVTPANVMATLIQVLRAHGLLLLEQGNNLLIHKSPDIKQIAKLVTESGQEGNAPIVTRIFRLQNVKPSSVAAIVQPMISTSAILETSDETKQLILTDVTANVDKIATLIENLDSPHTLLEIKSYQALHNPPRYLVELASQIMNPMTQGNPFIIVPQELAHEIFIVSTPELVDKALEVFKGLDTEPKEKLGALRKSSAPEDVFVYKVLHRPGSGVLAQMAEIGASLQKSDSGDVDLIQTIETAKWIKETNSIMLIGTKSSIEKAKEFLTALDAPVDGSSDLTSFFVYKPQYKSAEEVNQAIHEMADNLKGAKGASQSLIETIKTSKVNPLTHTISFSGEEKNFPRIKELLASIDVGSKKTDGNAPISTQFFIYKPAHQTGEQLSASLTEVSAQLRADKLADPALLHSLETMKWVKSTNSLLFTGDPDSLKKIQSLITTFDVDQTTENTKTFFQYHPQYATEGNTENYLKQISQNLQKKGGSESLIDTLKSYKWIPESQSFMFYGTKSNLDQVKNLLAAFDTTELHSPKEKPSYFIYKVKHTSGDLIEEDLENLAKSMKASGIKDPGLIDLISKVRYVKQTNSLLLSGSPQAIEEAKQLIAEYDYPREPEAPTASNFFMYKPVNTPARKIEKNLKEVSTNLKKAGLADPNLLRSIETSKYVDTTNTLIFTGSPETLQKIQGLIKDIDLAPTAHKPIQHIGKTTFLLYKLKNAGGEQILSSIRNVSSELKKSPNTDKQFVDALNSVKYVKETHSLFFTGTEESLEKVQHLVEQFDVTNLAAPQKVRKTKTPTTHVGPGNFFVYKPQSLTGPDLENILENFAENLHSSGLVDEDLYDTINSVRWSDQTQTLVFTGSEKSLTQIKALLKDFDVPSSAKGNTDALNQGETSIQAIDNTSFLVYKLQFHKGDEIQNALRQIAKDLMLTSAPVNKGLLNSINSIQWLEVTNSLLCSGDQDTLTRLRELIKNLDIPLKQVFIEMLVIETTMTNALNFGLEWGANYKYRNKFGAASYNSQPIETGDSPSSFLTKLSGLTPPTEPTPVGNIPPSSGFDLGVIGEVIRHNGQTFLTLGSLLSALQTDAETSVVMTPKILTQDGRTSTIFDGRNIPFVGSFVQNNGANSVNTSNIEYRDIGLNLTVTPVLGNSDIVTLDINLDRTQALTDVTGATINLNSATATGITTSKTTMQTTVHVPDNNFLILSGMVNNSNAKSKAGIPCLGGLPLIGAAFSKNADTIVNSNIVIFIRPHVINSIDEMRNITKTQEDYFRDQAGSPYLEQHYDEAMELIKTIDDE